MAHPPLLLPGDHVPWFSAPALSGAPNYSFQTVAGRHILMLFFGSARMEASVAALQLVQDRRQIFDDVDACFFGITLDREDEADGRIAQMLPGIRYFLDYGRQVSQLYGAMTSAGGGSEVEYRPHWLLVDPGLRVIGRYPIDQGVQAVDQLQAAIAAARQSEPAWAPILQIPNIFEPELCRELIALYENSGGTESGFMRDVEGKTVMIVDAAHKQRRDCIVEEQQLKSRIVGRMTRRLNPALKRAFQFEATRIERYLVACYDASGGYFRPHRDNTTKGTAHRQFAVTINLNADEFDGGELRFPEFGRRTYRAPTGGAVVFSCSLLHEAMPVTRGRRYAFLPFLYDEAAAQLREANNPYLGEGVGEYRIG
jgi:predicted 2-oxoglutarate/Fe(II)-dependent dioxygenase YbiX/peroxiredoxin